MAAPATLPERVAELLTRGDKVIALYWLRDDGSCSCGRPCQDVGKHPIHTDWPERASSDRATVEKWLRRWPAMNFGWLMGDERIGLDVDVKAADGKATFHQLEREHGPLPRACVATTPSGGAHLVLNNPNGAKLRTVTDWRPGVSVRAGNAYLVIEPSKTDKGEYRFNRFTELDDAPDWLLEMLPRQDDDQATAADFELDEAAALPERAQRLLDSEPSGRFAGIFDHQYDKPGDQSDSAWDHSVLWEFLVEHPDADDQELADLLCAHRASPHGGGWAKRPSRRQRIDYIRRTITAAREAVGDRQDRVRVTSVQSDGDPAAAATSTPEPTPAFPVEQLPGPAADYVWKLHEGGLPLDYLGPAALGILAAAVGGLCVLEIAAGIWTEPLILWYVLVGLPGTGKTPALQALRRPLDAIEQPWREQYREEVASYRRLSLAERKQTPRPVSRRLLFGNATLEKLVRILEPEINAPGLLLLADEIRSTIGGLGQYKTGGGSDRADFLSLWSGTPISYDRVHDQVEIYVGRPVVSIVGGLQPHHLPVLSGDDGLRDRFCLSWHSAPPTPEVPPIARANAEARAWNQLIEKMASKRNLPRTRALSESGAEFFHEARTRLRRIQIAGDSPEHLADWTSKATSHLARHALLLAEADGRGDVDCEYLERAEEITGYFTAHCRALPLQQTNLMLPSHLRGQDEAVDRLVEHLRRQPKQSATRRDLQRARVAHCRTVEEFERLIQRYEATYPGCIRTELAGHQERQVLYAPGAQPRDG